MHPSHIYFLFLDGIGLGPPDPSNPFAHTDLPSFERLGGGQQWIEGITPINTASHCFHPIDANLDMPGFPQSGTGQATLFTGINASKLAGKHYGPFPHSATKPTIASHNIFQQILDLKLDHPEPGVFINAFPPIYFANASKRNRWSVTTLSCRNAGLRIRTVDDVMAGKALTAEITGQVWNDRLKLPVPVLTPQQAGKQWVALGADHCFSLFEYFLTDKAGHGRLKGDPADILRILDGFLEGFLEAFDTEHQLLILTSDHGNLEDLSTKSHTRNPVPFLAYGACADRFAHVASLTEVTPAIIQLFREHAMAKPEIE